MKKKKVVKKKLNKKPLIFLAILLVIGTVGTTFADYFSEVIITNKFKTMTNKVSMNIESNRDWGTYKVKFTSTEETNTEVALRINLNEFWRKEVSGVKLSLSNKIGDENVVTKGWTETFLNDFVDGGDGWYYYKKTLKPKETIEVIESINLNEELIQTSPYYEDYKSYIYEINFNYEAIQATSKAISKVWEKETTISKGNITWKF